MFISNGISYAFCNLTPALLLWRDKELGSLQVACTVIEYDAAMAFSRSPAAWISSRIRQWQACTIGITLAAACLTLEYLGPGFWPLVAGKAMNAFGIVLMIESGFGTDPR